MSSRVLKSKNIGSVYLAGIETLSCCLLLRMARVDTDRNLTQFFNL